MIHWYDKLYMDDYSKQNKDMIIKRIDKNELNFQIYCIAFASNENNLFDIINVNELLFKHYRRNQIHILGIASCKSAAVDLITIMINEIYENTKSFDVRNYFKFS